MARHRFVHGQIANHVVVIFTKERFFPFLGPILRRRRNGKECFAGFVEWARRIAICNSHAAFEFRHCDYVQRCIWNGHEIMRPDEIGGLANNFFCVTDNCGVVWMLFGKFIEDRCCYLMFVRERCRVRVGKIFFVERHRSFVDGGLRLFQVRLRALQDFFHRQVRGERETQFLSKLFRAEAEVAIGAWQQIVLKPVFVVLQSSGSFLL